MSISKCPDCEDGYLIVKPVKNKEGTKTQYLLGCTNYKKDGTGCKSKLITIDKYTQSKEEFALTFCSNDMLVENMVYCGLPIKDLVRNIFKIIIVTKKTYANYNINPKCIIDVLTGAKTKVIDTFNLNSLKEYNTIDKIHSKRLMALLIELQNEKILEVDKGNYLAINILRKDLNDNDFKILFLSLAQRLV